MSQEENDQIAEIDAMRSVAEAVKGLGPDSVRRVLSWAADSFGVAIGPVSKKQGKHVEDDFGNGSAGLPPAFDDIADLFSAAAPQTDPDKALVVGYWLQYVAGETEFDSQRINKMLKDMGYPISNITSAFTSLKGRKPQLAMQTKKSGTSQQSRKKYKLTLAGKTAVENMISPPQS